MCVNFEVTKNASELLNADEVDFFIFILLANIVVWPVVFFLSPAHNFSYIKRLIYQRFLQPTALITPQVIVDFRSFQCLLTGVERQFRLTFKNEHRKCKNTLRPPLVRNGMSLLKY